MGVVVEKAFLVVVEEAQILVVAARAVPGVVRVAVAVEEQAEKDKGSQIARH